MAYIIECKYGESVDFTGPFDSERDAKVFLLLPIDGSILHCQRQHTIRELITPHAGKVDLSTVMRIVDEAAYEIRQEKTLQLARRSPAFFMDKKGNRHYDPSFEEIRDNLIPTIKALRDQFEGLGLKEAKDIVDGWRDNLNNCWHPNGKVGDKCPDCSVFVK